MTDKNDLSAEIQEELNELSPTLAKIPRQHPYSVPEGYFEQLSDQASQMAQDIGVQRTPTVLRLINVRSVAVAASIVIIAMLVWMNNFGDKPEQLASNDISIDEMIDYLENENSSGMDEDELVDELIEMETMLTAEEIQEEETLEILDDEVTAEDIIEYLLENNIDLTMIMNEIN